MGTAKRLRTTNLEREERPPLPPAPPHPQRQDGGAPWWGSRNPPEVRELKNFLFLPPPLGTPGWCLQIILNQLDTAHPHPPQPQNPRKFLEN